MSPYWPYREWMENGSLNRDNSGTTSAHEEKKEMEYRYEIEKGLEAEKTISRSSASSRYLKY